MNAMNNPALTYRVQRTTTSSMIGLSLLGICVLVLISAPFWADRSSLRLVAEFAYYLALGLPEHQQLHPAGLVAVRQGEQVWVYINRCPHFSVPLDYRPQAFCTYRGKVLMCAHHSAMFRFEDGHCIDGPCKGAQLEPVPVRWAENRLVMDVNC